MDLLRLRSLEPELMDGEDYTSDEFLECLRQLQTINTLTGGYRLTLRAIAEFVRAEGRRGSQKRDRGGGGRGPLRILDIGFGYGDMLREIAHWARRNHIDVELVGIDINPLAARLAAAVTPRWMRVRYITADVFKHHPPKPYDITINALFTHHLSDARIVKLLHWQALHSRLGFFINDLHRHPLAFHFIRHFTHLLGFNRLIRHDAALSVARSFRAKEWNEYARLAGLAPDGLRVEWYWSFRYGIRYEHNEHARK